MAYLFENFILNFYKLERTDLEVKKERIYWVAKSATDPELKYLPTMETDISIRDENRTLIIDAKYYKETFQTYYDSSSIHSGNLYQILAYLQNLKPRGGNDRFAEGMLLYPVVNEKVRLSYEMQGHKLQICTVDLSKEWRDVKSELLELVA